MYRVALQMLFGDRGKFFGIVLGVTFATLIMTQQPAIFLGLMSRTFAFVGDVALPDIWVMDPSVQFVEENKALRDSALWRVRGVNGVEWAVPLYKGMLTVTLPDGSKRSAELNGLDDATLIGAPPRMVAGSIADLRRTDGIIVDAEAAATRLRWVGADGQKRPLAIGDVIEMNERRAVVVGLAKMSRTFTLQPMIFTTYSRALQYTPPQRRKMSYVLVKAGPNSDINSLTQQITSETGLMAYSADAFKWVNVNYWMSNTGIPINFGISVLLGFLVGAAIAGQVFYNFTRENLKQFATLKAIGVTNGRLLRMIFLQAITVGVIGYGLGVGLTTLFAMRVKDSVLAFFMPWQLLLFSLTGVSIIILLAALLSARSVLKLEPAIVFK